MTTLQHLALPLAGLLAVAGLSLQLPAAAPHDATLADSPAGATGDPAGTYRLRTGCLVNELGKPVWDAANQRRCVLTGLASTTDVRAVETKLYGADAPAAFDIVYRYHDLTNNVGNADEVAITGTGAGQLGRLLHVAIASREGNVPKDYTLVTRGDYDHSLREQALAIKQMGSPVFVTFEQEGNDPGKAGRTWHSDKSVSDGLRGTPAEFIAAWRHVRALYRSLGVDNAVFVWVMQGGSKTAIRRADELWPGNDWVDWISWNVYNDAGCRQGAIDAEKSESFLAAAQPFYTWATTDDDVERKPMMISEAGSAKFDPIYRTANWYRGIPAALDQMPLIKAVTLWSSVDDTGSDPDKLCDYTIQNDPALRSAVRDMVDGLHAR